MLNRDAPSRSAMEKTTPAGMIGKGVTARSPLNIPLRHTESMTTTNAAPGLGSPAGALNPLAVEPVSYTHLRAHETDSYLVCRLLLEKKKKKKTNKIYSRIP